MNYNIFDKIKSVLFISFSIVLPAAILIVLIGYFYIPSEIPKYNYFYDFQITELRDSRYQLEVPAKTSDKEILVSMVGDVVIGTDDSFNYDSSLMEAFDSNKKDYKYFFKNVSEVFSEDDITIANLENPLTDSSTKSYKGEGTVFNFKGPMDFVKILSSSSVEAVTISNNHIYDYGNEGFQDTVDTLNNSNIDCIGENFKLIKEIDGIKFAFLGYQGWYNSSELLNSIKNDIEDARSEGCTIVIPYFHWGDENQYTPNDTQIYLAHYAIDSGATMVWGSHPHVIQSFELYKDKLIAYSMGNFCFGGNNNPKDKKSMILQTKFIISNNTLEDIAIKVIPTRISSTEEFNDYVPTPYKEQEAKDFLEILNNYSPTLNNKISNDYINLKSLSKA